MNLSIFLGACPCLCLFGWKARWKEERNHCDFVSQLRLPAPLLVAHIRELTHLQMSKPKLDSAQGKRLQYKVMIRDTTSLQTSPSRQSPELTRSAHHQMASPGSGGGCSTSANFDSGQLRLRPGRRGSHTTARDSKLCTFQGPGASYTTKIPRKDPQERERRKKIVAGEGKNSAKFWALHLFGASTPLGASRTSFGRLHPFGASRPLSGPPPCRGSFHPSAPSVEGPTLCESKNSTSRRLADPRNWPNSKKSLAEVEIVAEVDHLRRKRRMLGENLSNTFVWQQDARGCPPEDFQARLDCVVCPRCHGSRCCSEQERLTSR